MSAELARLIMQASPVTPFTYAADELALVLLLADKRVLEVGRVSELLGIPQSTASGLIDRCVASGRVSRRRPAQAHRAKRARQDGLDARQCLIVLTDRAKKELGRARCSANTR